MEKEKSVFLATSHWLNLHRLLHYNSLLRSILSMFLKGVNRSVKSKFFFIATENDFWDSFWKIIYFHEENWMEQSIMYWFYICFWIIIYLNFIRFFSASQILNVPWWIFENPIVNFMSRIKFLIRRSPFCEWLTFPVISTAFLTE